MRQAPTHIYPHIPYSPYILAQTPPGGTTGNVADVFRPPGYNAGATTQGPTLQQPTATAERLTYAIATVL
eukprot:6339744-Pyramimonas_sp.AAC.1